MKLKRSGLCPTAIGVLVLSLGLLNAEPGYAAGKQCSLATLKGQYMVAATGTLFPPAFGLTAQSLSTALIRTSHPPPPQVIPLKQTALEPKRSFRTGHISIYSLRSTARV